MRIFLIKKEIKIVPSGVEPPSPGPKPRRITTTLRDYKHFDELLTIIANLKIIHT